MTEPIRIGDAPCACIAEVSRCAWSASRWLCQCAQCGAYWLVTRKPKDGTS